MLEYKPSMGSDQSSSRVEMEVGTRQTVRKWLEETDAILTEVMKMVAETNMAICHEPIIKFDEEKSEMCMMEQVEKMHYKADLVRKGMKNIYSNML